MLVHEMSLYHGRRGADWVLGQMPGMRQFQTLQECSRARFSAVFAERGSLSEIHPFSSQHCILERMLVSLTQKHLFSQFHPCQSVSEDRLFYEYDFSDKLGDIFS